MIDFKKKIGASVVSKQIDPILLYDNLDRHATAGPLREVQRNVLEDWYANHKNDKDIIIKLHTGEGKTLIGLLLLQSRLNAGLGPCLFACPSKQLAEQVAADAEKFGVKHYLDQGGELPLEFTEGETILITHIHRVFNGITKFGLDNSFQRVGTIVLDDSHACIDAIKEACAIKIARGTILFETLLSMFADSLKQQGEGTYLEIRYNDFSSSVMAIPYWDWIAKKSEIANLFFENQDNNAVKFAYPLLKDIWEDCTAYVTSYGIEIVPDYNLISRFSFFVNCKQRVLMSATTQDDSFFIKGLDFSVESVLHPLTDKTHAWSGEKMILFPSRIDESLSVDFMRRCVCEIGQKTSNSTIVLVPSYRLADQYVKNGAHVVTNDTRDDELSYIRSGSYGDHTVVFVNRYDGIDLPDNQCRILVIDSLPIFGGLADRYEQCCREDSKVIAIKVAQKIEQGLGRSVRGEKDYSVILMIGEDLVRFVKTSENQLLFSTQTRKQIEIAEDVTNSVKDEIESERPLKSLIDVIKQCLNRDEGWKAFYQETMNTIVPVDDDHSLIEIITKEGKAEKSVAKRNYKEAAGIYQDLANSFVMSNLEQGWYLQKVAKCEYRMSEVLAKKIQKRAHENNPYVLMPDDVVYSPIGSSNQTYIQHLTDGIRKVGSYEDWRMQVDEILAHLVFGISANTFERALDNLGKLLGYQCQRPDNTYKVGPDNLWVTPSERRFFAIECKNEVLTSRDFISKEEVGQLNNHIGWFESNYPLDKNVTYIHLHTTNVVSNKANYCREGVRVMTQDQLELLKNSVKAFVHEFSSVSLSTITDQFVNECLAQHKLRPEDIVKHYTMCPVVDKTK